MRHKEFNPEEVLEKAMELIWRQGYEATSVQDLVEHTGVNRQSLYDTFGGKHELFMAALDRYTGQVIRQRAAVLDQPGSAVEAIRRFFRGFVEMAGTPQAACGCLVANSVVELAPHDEATHQRIDASLSWLEERFYKTLVRAREQGELVEGQNPRALARFLTCLLMGGTVLAKAGKKRKVFEDIVDTGLSVLE